MRAPTASELLAVWERCTAQTPAERALELLALASPEAPARELEELTAGERDARLLDLRELAFGPELAGVGTCASCGELVEFSIDAGAVRAGPPVDDGGPLRLSCAGYELRFRLPTTGDLAAISSERDPEFARLRLLEHCLLEARRNGAEESVQTLPELVTTAVAERMAEADPQADVELAFSCPACGHVWSAAFDVGSFLWSELDAWTRRTLHDVHALASAYGWSESEILALGTRRQLYLELVRG